MSFRRRRRLAPGGCGSADRLDVVSTPPPAPAPERFGRGILFSLGAFGLWGVLPVYFLLLAPAGAFEIVGWRVIFSLVFCVVLLSATRGWAKMYAILRDRRTALTLLVAGLFMVVNWLVFIYAATSGHVVEASLGYFANPVITVLLGVFVLREKLRPLQWAAIGISVVAVVVLAINYGAFPWISLLLAFSFGFYGLVKKRVGATVDAISGLAIETMWLAPIAAVMLVVVASTSGLAFGTIGAGHTLAMVGTGIVTAVPLLFFAAGSRRLPLVYMGLTQYLAPILQFVIGVFVLQEDMPVARWAGFAIVWVALIVLTVDMVRSARTNRARARVLV
jgi:chloramphenicol-sensitive protein RarD